MLQEIFGGKATYFSFQQFLSLELIFIYFNFNEKKMITLICFFSLGKAISKI